MLRTLATPTDNFGRSNPATLTGDPNPPGPHQENSSDTNIGLHTNGNSSSLPWVTALSVALQQKEQSPVRVMTIEQVCG
jgi:hypothetical protein